MVSAGQRGCNAHVEKTTFCATEILYTARDMSFAQVPNIITVARLAMIPLLILLLREQDYRAALMIFLIAGLSDGLDGFIARRYKLESHLGGVLDPMADKLLMLSTFVTLTLLGHIHFWLLLLVVSRDFLIIGGYLVVTSQTGAVKMQASIYSKLNTVVQILLVIVILFEQAKLFSVPLLVDFLIYSVLTTTVVSGVHYYWAWIIKKRVTPLSGQSKK